MRLPELYEAMAVAELDATTAAASTASITGRVELDTTPTAARATSGTTSARTTTGDAGCFLGPARVTGSTTTQDYQAPGRAGQG